MSDEAASPASVVCPACGGTNPEGARFCQECGQPIPLTPQNSTGSETIAFRPEDLSRLKQPDIDDTVPPASGDGRTTAFKTDIGKKHRVNQDCGGAWSWVRPDGTPVALLVVADGVSAGRHSEGASRLAVQIVLDRVSPLLQDPQKLATDVLEGLVDAIKEANHEIAARPHAAISNADATTVVAAFVIGRIGAGAWVGDSRIYRVSGERIERLTVDHSWAQGVVSRGLMSQEEASRDPRAHMIMRWLGPPDQEDPGIETFLSDLDAGDIVFCCTDGLYMYFAPPVTREEEMARVFAAHPDSLAGAIDQLVDSALARGGYDNISIAALRVPGNESSPRESGNEQPLRDDTVQFRFPGRRPGEADTN